jgi:hypothetical protein
MIVGMRIANTDAPSKNQVIARLPQTEPSTNDKGAGNAGDATLPPCAQPQSEKSDVIRNKNFSTKGTKITKEIRKNSCFFVLFVDQQLFRMSPIIFSRQARARG